MTLIDKAEALEAVHEADSLELAQHGTSRIADRIAALPARGVGVKPLIFSEFKEGGCMGRPHPFQYFITQAHNGRFLCHHDETWHETLEAAQAHAQVAYQSAALAPTDAAHVNETPKSEHDGADVLTAAQAREAALREAASAVRARYMGDNNREDQEVLRCEAAILALIDKPAPEPRDVRAAAADAIKMGFLSAAPGEWRVSDIERVTEAILRALEQEDTP